MHVWQPSLAKILSHYGLTFQEFMDLNKQAEEAVSEHKAEAARGAQELQETLGYSVVNGVKAAWIEQSPLLGHWKYGKKELV